MAASASIWSRIRTGVYVCFMSVVWAGILIGVSAGPTFLPKATLPDLQPTPSDLRRVSSDRRVIPSGLPLTPSNLQLIPSDLRRVPSDPRVTSSDLGRDPVELRRLLHARPDLRSVLERQEVSENRTTVFDGNTEDESAHPEDATAQIEAILKSLNQLVEAGVTDELGALSSNFFFSPVFSTRAGQGVSVSDSIIHNVGVIAQHAPGGTSLDSSTSRTMIPESHSAASIQPEKAAFVSVVKQNQPFKSSENGIRARTAILTHPYLPSDQSGGKAVIHEVVEPQLRWKSDIREINSFLAPKRSDTTTNAGKHKGPYNYPATGQFVARNYLVNGINNGATLHSPSHGDIENARAMKNIVSKDMGILGRDEMVHVVVNSTSLENNLSDSASDAMVHHGLLKDGELPVGSLETGKQSTSLTDEEEYKTNGSRLNSLSVEEPQAENATHGGSRQVQSADADVESIDHAKLDRSTTLDNLATSQFETAPPSGDPAVGHLQNKDSHDFPSAGTTTERTTRSGSQLQDTKGPGSQLQDIVGSISKSEDTNGPGPHLHDIVEARSKSENTNGSESQQQDIVESRSKSENIDVPGSQLQNTSGLQSQLENTQGAGSHKNDTPGSTPQLQNTKRPGSQIEDILELGSEFPDILGRGGDLLDGIVVYTINPFAGRRRGTRRPARLSRRPSSVSPAGGDAARTDQASATGSRDGDVLFTCHDRDPGYYPVKQTGCQVYYHCTEESRRFQYRCGGGTAFNTNTLVCDHINNVVCDKFGTGEL